MFQPGISGNANGRPKGSLNKKTLVEKPLKQWFKDKNVHPLDFIMSCLNKQKSIIESIEDPAEKSKAYNEVTKRALEILPYVAPKLKEQEDSSEAIGINPEYEKALENATSDQLLSLLKESV